MFHFGLRIQNHIDRLVRQFEYSTFAVMNIQCHRVSAVPSYPSFLDLQHISRQPGTLLLVELTNIGLHGATIVWLKLVNAAYFLVNQPRSDRRKLLHSLAFVSRYTLTLRPQRS